jgi:ribonuclease E
MSKEIYISSTPHETRLAIVEKDELTEIYYERENEYTLAGSIYNGRVTRVLPGMQSSFVDIGLERDAFLYITDFMEEAADTADFEGADGGRSRGRGRSSGEAPVLEGETAVRSEGEGRARSEGEGRGRGGRDRGHGRRDERPREDRPREDRPREAQQGEPAFIAPIASEGFDSEGGDVGEGAPGADGGRRWRGRRGRRRGRGPGEEAAAPVAQDAEIMSAPEVLEEAALVDVESQPRENRERGGRERGRGGVRGRLDAIRERFAPRGDRSRNEPEHNSVDLEASSGPAAEPFILPGESLGKYRPRDEQAEAASAKHAAETIVAARPSAGVVVTGWDGGATLPGETLRPRGGNHDSRSSGGESRSREDRPREDRGGRDAGGRDRRRDRDRGRGRSGGEGRQSFESKRMDPAEAVQPGVTAQHDTNEAPSFSDDASAYVEATFEQGLQARAEEHQAELAAPVEFHEATTEYEPEENASASFRADTVHREFRQNVPQDDLAEAAFEDVEEHEAPPAAEPAHEFTSLQATGEMLSEAPLEAAPQDAERSAAPIEHEAAIQEGRMYQAGQTLVPPFDLISNPMAFSPGDGALEEELIDEDEELPQMHASVADDEMEEETLEGTADLGSMLREMSIDQMTRAEVPAEDDEEDFDVDEEDIEEDAFESGEDELAGSDEGEVEEEEFAEAGAFEEGEGAPAVEGQPAEGEGAVRARRGRRDGRRGGRDRGGKERGSREGSSREGVSREAGSSREGAGREGAGREGAGREGGSREGSGSRDRRGMAGSRSGGRGRHSVQAMDLPAISDLLKPGQEVLVQIAKEPIAKKGARITSHIALPGRFLVFMPTVNHTGVSRKIESDAERRRLREILLSEKGEASGGFIVRTAASGASEEELRSDLRFLLNLWTDIKQRSESSKSPALIYHDLNLIERILRDQVTDNFSAIWVDTEAEYERVLRFLQRFQPNLIRRVKLYTKDTPLFEQFGITEEINKALRSKVWLKSGGSIVINQTEALVAIDINTGKFVGKTTKLEDTIVKTNLDSIPEIVRQIRLRDLGGIIIIDFIDMDERKNRNKVMAALEDELKKDRAPSKVLQFNDFGLVAITRKRVKQSLERTLSTTCGVCAGTGMVKSPVTVANDIYVEMRKMHKTLDKGDIMLRVHPEVVKQLKTGGGKWLQEMEEMSGKTILVKSDPALHPEQFDIH